VIVVHLRCIYIFNEASSAPSWKPTSCTVRIQPNRIHLEPGGDVYHCDTCDICDAVLCFHGITGDCTLPLNLDHQISCAPLFDSSHWCTRQVEWSTPRAVAVSKVAALKRCLIATTQSGVPFSLQID
jgi:hypothetical protein